MEYTDNSRVREGLVVFVRRVHHDVGMRSRVHRVLIAPLVVRRVVDPYNLVLE